MRFTCNGTLTQLIYRTSPGGSPFGLDERFQLWQFGSANETVSNVVRTISTRRNEVLFRSINSNITLYSINNLNVPVQANNHLSFDVVLIRSFLQFLRASTSEYYYYTGPILSSITFEGQTGIPLLPLITAVISRMLNLLTLW